MQEFWHGAAMFLLYALPVATIMFTARAMIRIPDELFRKILHFILLGAYFPFLFGFDTWWKAALLALCIAAIAYPILWLLGRLPRFSSFVNERKAGEFRSSLLLAMGMIMLSAGVDLGWLGDRLLVLACIYAWGVGDAFAALIGKRFGRHKIRLPGADPRKSWEGTAAMFTASALSVLLILLIRGGLGFGSCLLISLAAAAVTAYVELCTKNGLDTITCPTAAMAVILPLIKLLGG